MIARMLFLITLTATAVQAQSPELPEFNGKLYITAVYSAPMTEDDAKLATFLRQNQNMATLCSQTIFNEFNDNTKLIKETSWAKRLGTERPVLLVQGVHDANGQADVLFFVKGKHTYDSDFVHSVGAALREYDRHCKEEMKGQRPLRPWRPICPGPDCPQPTPQPQPPAPPPVPIVPTVPDIKPIVPIVVPEVKEEGGGAPLLYMVLAALGAGALAVKKNVE